MKVIAIRQLRGDYGSVRAGEEFDVHPEIGNKLLKSGVVREPDAFTYEVKAIQPSHIDPAVEAPKPAHANKRK